MQGKVTVVYYLNGEENNIKIHLIKLIKCICQNLKK